MRSTTTLTAATLATAVAAAPALALAPSAQAHTTGAKVHTMTRAGVVTGLSVTQAGITGSVNLNDIRYVNGTLYASGSFTGTVNGTAVSGTFTDVAFTLNTVKVGHHWHVVIDLGAFTIDGVTVDLAALHIEANQRGKGNLTANLFRSLDRLIDAKASTRAIAKVVAQINVFI